MPTVEGVVYCHGCGVEVIGPPETRNGLIYCCAVCADGGECDCGPEEEDPGAAIVPSA